MTSEKQAELITKACEKVGLKCSIKWIGKKSDANTYAEKIALLFKGKGKLPVKDSYMYCDSLDVSIFYGKDDTPMVSYAGYTKAKSSDLCKGKLTNAFDKIKELLDVMDELAKEA